MSLRPSGLAESPLYRIGLALRLLAVELVDELLEKPDLRRLGMMRTMAGSVMERKFDGDFYLPLCGCNRLPGFEFAVAVSAGRSGTRIPCSKSRVGSVGVAAAAISSGYVTAELQQGSSSPQRFAPAIWVLCTRRN